MCLFLFVGTFGRVSLVQDKKSKAVYALKAMMKSEIVAHKQQANVINEKDIMIKSNHPFILRLYQVMIIIAVMMTMNDILLMMLNDVLIMMVIVVVIVMMMIMNDVLMTMNDVLMMLMMTMMMMVMVILIRSSSW